MRGREALGVALLDVCEMLRASRAAGSLKPVSSAGGLVCGPRPAARLLLRASTKLDPASSYRRGALSAALGASKGRRNWSYAGLRRVTPGQSGGCGVDLHTARGKGFAQEVPCKPAHRAAPFGVQQVLQHLRLFRRQHDIYLNLFLAHGLRYRRIAERRQFSSPLDLKFSREYLTNFVTSTGTKA